jgi:hypothetical protein
MMVPPASIMTLVREAASLFCTILTLSTFWVFKIFAPKKTRGPANEFAFGRRRS